MATLTAREGRPTRCTPDQDIPLGDPTIPRQVRPNLLAVASSDLRRDPLAQAGHPTGTPGIQVRDPRPLMDIPARAECSPRGNTILACV